MIILIVKIIIIIIVTIAAIIIIVIFIVIMLIIIIITIAFVITTIIIANVKVITIINVFIIVIISTAFITNSDSKDFMNYFNLIVSVVAVATAIPVNWFNFKYFNEDDMKQQRVIYDENQIINFAKVIMVEGDFVVVIAVIKVGKK